MRRMWMPSASSAIMVIFFAAIAAGYRGKVLFSDQTYYSNDIYQEFFEFKDYLRSAVSQGRFPMWCPEQLSGMPLVPNPQAGVFYPTTLLFLLLPFSLALSLHYTVHTFLAGLAMYAFLREVHLQRWPATLGGLLASCSGFQAWEVIHPQTLAASVWMAPALFFVERGKDRKSAMCAWLTGACLAMSFLAGNPQMFLGSLYVIVGYALYRRPWGPGYRLPMVRWVASMGAGMALASVMALPFVELALQGQRSGGLSYEEAASYSLPLRGLLLLFCPFQWALQVKDPRWMVRALYLLHQHAAELTAGASLAYIGYLGSVALLLSFSAVAVARRPPVLFFAIVSLLSLWLCTGSCSSPLSLHKLLFYALPGFRFLRTPFRYFFLYNHCMAVVAAFGFSALLQGRRNRLILIAVASIVVTLGVTDAAGHPEPVRWFMTLHAVPCFVAVLAACLLSTPWTPRMALPLVLLAGVDLFWYMDRSWPVAHRDVFEFRHCQSLLTFLKDHLSDERIFIEKQVELAGGAMAGASPVAQGDPYLSLPANLSMVYGLKNASGYNPLTLARYADFLGLGDRARRWLRVRYVISPAQDPPSGSVVWTDGRAAITDLGPPLPRVWIVKRLKCVRDENDALAVMSDPTFDPTQAAVILSSDVPAMQGSSFGQEDAVFVEEDRSERISVQVTLSSPGILVFPDPDYPGWKAMLDGRRQRIHRVDFCFRGVFVPAGRHVLTLSYCPWSLFFGGFISVSSLLWLMGLMAWPLLRRRDECAS